MVCACCMTRKAIHRACSFPGRWCLMNFLKYVKQEAGNNDLLKQGRRIPSEYGGYLVSAIWNVLMFELLQEPKLSYVKHFHELDAWQQQTDIKMFEAIEAAVLQEMS